MQSKYTAKDIERIWGKVDKESSRIFYNGTRCWEWSASRTTGGYGHISIGNKILYTHRIVYELHNGEVSKGLQILHHCDNPPCCNPSHLFQGTQKENMDDMNKKQRRNDVYGEANPKSKLTDEQVAEIRRRYSQWGIGGEGARRLAREFGVSARYILDLVKWKNRKG